MRRRHLIIVVMQSALEQDLDAGPQLRDQGTKLCQAAHCRRPHSGVLQNDPVVDVADVLGGLLGAGALHAQQMQHLGGQVCELTVLQLPTAGCQLTRSSFIQAWLSMLRMAEQGEA